MPPLRTRPPAIGLFATPLDELIATDNLVRVVEAIKAKHLRVLNNRPKYKRRQAIVEHPFGTIKRSWGFYYTLLKGKEKVNGEYSLIFLAYNMRRALSILGVSDLIERVKGLFFGFFVPKRPVAAVGRATRPDFLFVVWRAVAREEKARRA